MSTVSLDLAQKTKTTKQKINKAKLHQIKNKASFQPRKASTKWKDNSQNERKAYMNYEIPLRDTIMYYWSSRRREGEKGAENVFKEIMNENFVSWGRYLHNQVHGAQMSPKCFNSKGFLQHIVI